MFASTQKLKLTTLITAFKKSVDLVKGIKLHFHFDSFVLNSVKYISFSILQTFFETLSSF